MILVKDKRILDIFSNLYEVDESIGPFLGLEKWGNTSRLFLEATQNLDFSQIAFFVNRAKKLDRSLLGYGREILIGFDCLEVVLIYYPANFITEPQGNGKTINSWSRKASCRIKVLSGHLQNIILDDGDEGKPEIISAGNFCSIEEGLQYKQGSARGKSAVFLSCYNMQTKIEIAK